MCLTVMGNINTFDRKFSTDKDCWPRLRRGNVKKVVSLL